MQVVHKFEHPGNNDNMLMKWEMVIITSRAILWMIKKTQSEFTGLHIHICLYKLVSDVN